MLPKPEREGTFLGHALMVQILPAVDAERVFVNLDCLLMESKVSCEALKTAIKDSRPWNE